jgi:hypothetical protein
VVRSVQLSGSPIHLLHVIHLCECTNQKVGCYVAPSLIVHLQSTPCEDQIIYLSKVQRRQTHHPVITTSIGGVMHAMCQALEHLSHTNIWAAPPLNPHNIHLKSARTTAKLGSTIPSTFGRWHDALPSHGVKPTWGFHKSQIAESWDLEARSRLPTLERGRGSSWEPRD